MAVPKQSPKFPKTYGKEEAKQKVALSPTALKLSGQSFPQAAGGQEFACASEEVIAQLLAHLVICQAKDNNGLTTTNSGQRMTLCGTFPRQAAEANVVRSTPPRSNKVKESSACT